MYCGHGIIIEVLCVAMESSKVASAEGVSKIALPNEQSYVYSCFEEVFV